MATKLKLVNFLSAREEREDLRSVGFQSGLNSRKRNCFISRKKRNTPLAAFRVSWLVFHLSLPRSVVLQLVFFPVRRGSLTEDSVNDVFD